VIPASFEYHRPKDMAGVLSILEEHGDDARVMAGGHSLIPMMKLRMADVPHLIDLAGCRWIGGYYRRRHNHHWRHGHPIRHHFT
jgi:carbon-monoxide dehydrogenase medium subunit